MDDGACSQPGHRWGFTAAASGSVLTRAASSRASCILCVSTPAGDPGASRLNLLQFGFFRHNDRAAKSPRADGDWGGCWRARWQLQGILGYTGLYWAQLVMDGCWVEPWGAAPSWKQCQHCGCCWGQEWPPALPQQQWVVAPGLGRLRSSWGWGSAAAAWLEGPCSLPAKDTGWPGWCAAAQGFNPGDETSQHSGISCGPRHWNSPGVFVGLDSARGLVEDKSAGEDVVGTELPRKLLLDKEGGRWEQILPVGKGGAGSWGCLLLWGAPEEPVCHLCPLLCAVCRRLCSCPRLRRCSWDPFGTVAEGAWSPQ